MANDSSESRLEKVAAHYLRFGATANGTRKYLVASAPTTFQSSWASLGLSSKPRAAYYRAQEKRQWWLYEIISNVRPGFWAERFGLPPRALVNSLKMNRWYYTVLDALAKAACRGMDIRWVSALWDLFDRLDRQERNLMAQPVAYFRLQMHHLAKLLSYCEFERRIVADARRVIRFSFRRFCDRWENVYREWPPEATRLFCQRFRELLKPTKWLQTTSKFEWLGLASLLAVLVKRTSPAALEYLFFPVSWPSLGTLYERAVHYEWAKVTREGRRKQARLFSRFDAGPNMRQVGVLIDEAMRLEDADDPLLDSY